MSYLIGSASFWFFVAFAVFMLGAFLKGRSIVAEKISSGIAFVTSELSHSKTLLKKAEELFKENQRILENAKKQSRAILKNAEDEVQIMKEEQENLIERDIKNLEKQANQKIKKAEEDALAFIKDTTLYVAFLTSEALLKEAYASPKAQADYLKSSFAKIQI